MRRKHVRILEKPYVDLHLVRTRNGLIARACDLRGEEWLQLPMETMSVEDFRVRGKEWLRARLVTRAVSLPGFSTSPGPEAGEQLRMEPHPRLFLQASTDDTAVVVTILHRINLTEPGGFGESVIVPFALNTAQFAGAVLAAFERCRDLMYPPFTLHAQALVHLIRVRGREQYYWCEWQPVEVPGCEELVVTSWGEPKLVTRQDVLERGLEVVLRNLREFPARARQPNPLKYPSAYLIDTMGLADQELIIVYTDKRAAKKGIALIQVFNYTTYDEMTQEVAGKPIEVSLSLPPMEYGRILIAALDLCAVEHADAS